MQGPSRRKSSFVEEPMQKILVGVAGGSAAGKTTLCENIYRQMAFDRNFKVEIISLDSFYKRMPGVSEPSTRPRWTYRRTTSTTPTPSTSTSPTRCCTPS